MKLNKLIVGVVFFCIYLFPTYYANNMTGINFTKYMFLGFVLLLYLLFIHKTNQTSKYELFLAMIIVIISYIKKSVESIVIMETLFLYKIVDTIDNKELKVSKNVLLLSLLGILLYSILFFGDEGRYIFTGLHAANQGGFELLMLFILIRFYNKKFGNILMLLGLLTFSRNYLLCLVLFIVLEYMKKKKIYTKLCNFFSFKKLLVIIVIVLSLLSIFFQYEDRNNKLGSYQSGINRYTNVLDYSNYFRFTVNTNLIKIYMSHPEKLLTGITDNEFYAYNFYLTLKEGMRYRKIKPHNFFFSYLRIYGIFALLIFWFLSKIFDKIIDKSNFSIFIVAFIYSNILGIGLANYWLYLTVIIMLIYKNGLKGDEVNG